MREAIKNFPEQFEFQPKVENAGKLKRCNAFAVAGMGGSNLAAGLLKIWNPKLNLIQHRDYGLPELPKAELEKTLLIASSYSGNTEETIDSFKTALKKKMPAAVIAVGGRLLELAKKYKAPYIQMPNAGIQPRMALGFNLRALLKLAGNAKGLKESENLKSSLKSNEYERAGKVLAKKLKGHIPAIYTSAANAAIGYNWKIKFNETGKIPAFANVFPELNHNEMTGFDSKDKTRELSQKFFFLFLKDPADHPRILKRMNVTERLYRERGFPAEVLILNGKNTFQKIFSSLLIADWTAYYAAQEYGVEAEQVPMIEEFKRLIK